LELPEIINGTSPVKSNERRQVSSPPFPGKVMFSKISFGSIVEGIFHPWRKAGRKEGFWIWPLTTQDLLIHANANKVE